MNGVWHKDGPLAQVEAMAEWAERGRTGDGIGPETAGKIADNLKAAVAALASPSSRVSPPANSPQTQTEEGTR